MSLDKNPEVILLADLIFGTLFHKQTCFYNGYETLSTENHTKVKKHALSLPQNLLNFGLEEIRINFRDEGLFV